VGIRRQLRYFSRVQLVGMQRAILGVGIADNLSTKPTAGKLNQIEKSNPFLGVYAASP
jgi:hypothetical protein